MGQRRKAIPWTKVLGQVFCSLLGWLLHRPLFWIPRVEMPSEAGRQATETCGGAGRGAWRVHALLTDAQFTVVFWVLFKMLGWGLPWWRICLPMQGTRVRALVWEDPTCHGATGPVSHNYWACASGACAPQREAAIVRGPRAAMKSGPCLPQLEKALAQKRRPNTAK